MEEQSCNIKSESSDESQQTLERRKDYECLAEIPQSKKQISPNVSEIIDHEKRLAFF